MGMERAGGQFDPDLGEAGNSAPPELPPLSGCMRWGIRHAIRERYSLDQLRDELPGSSSPAHIPPNGRLAVPFRCLECPNISLVLGNGNEKAVNARDTTAGIFNPCIKGIPEWPLRKQRQR